MEYHYLFVLTLLLIALHESEQGLVVTNPPQDNIVCVGDEVNITCGYNFSVKIVPVWMINGKPFSVSNINSSSIFESPIVDDTFDTLLTVYSANEMMNQTSFQCEFTFQPPVMSSIGVLTVMGPPAPPVIKVMERRLTSLVISWDTFSHTSCGDATYNVTLSDGTAELVEETTTTNNTISFTDLVNDTQYEVTVLAINNAGPGTVVTTNVSTLTPSVPPAPRNLAVDIKFIDYKPVVKITWNASPLSLNVPEVEGFAVFLTGEDDLPNMYEVGPDVTTFVSDDDISAHLNVGTYTISVCSVNSVGHSETVSAPLTVQWLKSASVQLLQDNSTISVTCDVTKSSPIANCIARLNCSKCDEVTTKVFTGQIEIPVLADTDYYITVQVVRGDNRDALEDYSEIKTISVPKPPSNPSSRTPTVSSSDDDNSLPYIAAVSAVVLLLIVLLVAVLVCWCVLRRRKGKQFSLESSTETKVPHSNGYSGSDGSLPTNGSIKDNNDIPLYSDVVDIKTPKRKSTTRLSAEVPSCSEVIPSYSEVVELKPKKGSFCLEGERSPATRSSSESSDLQKPLKPDSYAVVDMKKKHNRNNYVELAGFDDKRLTVMPVPVPEVNYSDVKIDLSKQDDS